MALESIEANGFDDVERVGEDFGMGILACVASPGDFCRLLSTVCLSDEADDEGGDDDMKTLDSYWGLKRIFDSQR